MKLDVVIADYPMPGSEKGDASRLGLAWRRHIHSAILKSASAQKIRYLRDADLDIKILLFMTERQMSHGHDLDNMLKHLLDALQGKLGGAGKTEQNHDAIVPVDSQFCRVTIEKRRRETQKEKSRLIIRGYRKGKRRGLV